MVEIYECWIVVYGVMIVMLVYWYLVFGGLKVMMDCFVCVDGGNFDLICVYGKDSVKVKEFELVGWDKYFVGCVFVFVVYGDVEGAE